MAVTIPIAPAFTHMVWSEASHEVFDFMDSSPQATVHDNTALAPRLGADHPRAGALFSQMNFKVEMAGEGSSALGTVPNIGPLLAACGLDETISAATSVTYDSTLLPGDITGATAVNIDKHVGNELAHACDSAVGNAIFNLVANQKAFVDFQFQGTYTTPAESINAAGLGTTGRPPVCKALTATVGGAVLVLKSCVINLGNAIASPREDMAGTNGIQPPKITNQRPTMAITAEMPAQATWNPWTIFTAETKIALSIVLGSVSKNIMTITGDWYAAGFPQETDIDGLLGFTMDFVQADETADTKFTIVYT